MIITIIIVIIIIIFIIIFIKYSGTMKSEQYQQQDLLTDGTSKRLQHVGLC
jgi:nitrogen fixation-related uncharacterized protein